MSSAVEATTLATPPPGIPPGPVPDTADPYTTTGCYGRFRFDPGARDVSDWLGVGAGNDDGSAAAAGGSDVDETVPDELSEARDLVLAYRAALWQVDTRKQPLRQLVAMPSRGARCLRARLHRPRPLGGQGDDRRSFCGGRDCGWR